MKKRSLVAAIAMLIVSALVLTTATYAWFASNSRVTVAQFETTIGTNDGSLLISADGSDWSKLSLAISDLEGREGNQFAATLVPVSFDATNRSFKQAGFGTGATANQLSTNASTVTTGFTKYAFYLASTQDNYDVTLTPQITGTNSFTYVAISVQKGSGSATTKVFGPSAYEPIIATSAAAVIDSNTNCIVDDGDAAVGVAPDQTTYSDMIGNPARTVTPESSTTMSFSVDKVATNITTVTVYIWAEGQNTNCDGATASNLTLGIQVDKA